MSEQVPDRVLVDRYLDSRDETSFRALYRAHTSALRRFALLRVGSEEADDVVQETWLRAARQLASFRWHSSLRTWLTGIALNLCRERYRRTARLRAVPDLPPTPGGGLGAVAVEDLRRAIGALPDGYREVLLLHDVEGHTHEEIAQLLGIQTGTTKSQLHRARHALREQLGNGEREEKPWLKS